MLPMCRKRGPIMCLEECEDRLALRVKRACTETSSRIVEHGRRHAELQVADCGRRDFETSKRDRTGHEHCASAPCGGEGAAKRGRAGTDECAAPLSAEESASKARKTEWLMGVHVGIAAGLRIGEDMVTQACQKHLQVFGEALLEHKHALQTHYRMQYDQELSAALSSSQGVTAWPRWQR